MPCRAQAVTRSGSLASGTCPPKLAGSEPVTSYSNVATRGRRRGGVIGAGCWKGEKLPPTETVWPLDEHTRGKHLILKHYLDAWLPILGTTQGRILFIDGFAGPGEYAGREPGSPVIALDAFLAHASARRMREVRFLFIEKQADRAEHLRQLLAARQLPPNCAVAVECAECEPTLIDLFNGIDADGRQLAPTLLMLDPFGVSGISMTLIRRLLAYPKTEVLISVMWESIRRFHETPEFERNLDELFATAAWRETTALPGEEARQATYELYERQLRDAGATNVLHFDLYRAGVLVYSLFFATKHDLGCYKMKEAIWKAAPDGRFVFRGERGGQLALDMSSPDYERLRKDLLQKLGDGHWTTIEQVERFMQSDRTLFCRCKREGLKELERRGHIIVARPTGAKKGFFPAGTRIRERQTYRPTCSVGAPTGYSSQVRPSSTRPPAFAVRPPHCFQKNAIFCRTQRSRRPCAHSGLHLRAPIPLSPPPMTQ